MKRYLTRFVSAVMLFALLTGCASVSFRSNKDPDHRPKMNRLYILVNHGSLSHDYSPKLMSAMYEVFTREGIEIKTEIMNPLVLDEKSYLANANRYKAEAVLII